MYRKSRGWLATSTQHLVKDRIASTGPCDSNSRNKIASTRIALPRKQLRRITHPDLITSLKAVADDLKSMEKPMKPQGQTDVLQLAAPK